LKLLAFYFIFSNVSSYAQIYTDENAKETLRQIWLSYIGWGAQSCTYQEPAEYIRDTNTQHIIGQEFITFSGEKKYDRIILFFKDNNIISAKLWDCYNVLIVWENKRIAKLKFESLAYADYSVDYNQNGEFIGLTGNQIINAKSGKIVYAKTFDIINGKIVKITGFENKDSGKKQWIRSITDYTYDNGATTLNSIIYTTGKPNKPENISKTLKVSYQKKDENTYMVMQSDNIVKEENTYNSDGYIKRKKITKGTSVEERTYKFINGKKFKVDIITTKNNEFEEHSVVVEFSLSNQPDVMPNYEKEKGTYKFNKQGELIYETNSSKYREKINGVWGDWKSFQY
jgi:hypothetical protein